MYIKKKGHHLVRSHRSRVRKGSRPETDVTFDNFTHKYYIYNKLVEKLRFCEVSFRLRAFTMYKKIVKFPFLLEIEIKNKMHDKRHASSSENNII